MAVDHFVGRQDAVHRLADVLTGRERTSGMLTVQSIEGPGGIGKTYLFDHVRTTNDLSNRNYLTLRIDGSDPSAGWPGLESLWTKPRGFAKRSNP